MKRLQGSVALLLTLFAVSALCAMRAQAQFDVMSMMRGAQYGPLIILSHQEVQKELNLTKTQRESLKKLQKEQTEALTKLSKNAQGGADPSKAMAMSKEMETMNAEYATKAQELLTEDQRKRLLEIRIQVMGFQAAFDPEVQTALAVTDTQKESLKPLYSSYFQALMSAVQDIRNAGGAKGKLDAEYKEKVAKILTDDQNAKWKTLEGAPFKDLKKVTGY